METNNSGEEDYSEGSFDPEQIGDFFHNKKVIILIAIATVLVAVAASLFIWISLNKKGQQDNSNQNIARNNNSNQSPGSPATEQLSNSNINKDSQPTDTASDQVSLLMKEQLLDSFNVTLDEKSPFFQEKNQEVRKWQNDAKLIAFILNFGPDSANGNYPYIYFYSSKNSDNYYIDISDKNNKSMSSITMSSSSFFQSFWGQENGNPSDMFGYIDFSGIKVDPKKAFRIGTDELQNKYSDAAGPESISLVYFKKLNKHVWIINGRDSVRFIIDAVTGDSVDYYSNLSY